MFHRRTPRTRGQIQLDLVQTNRFWCHDFVVFAVFQYTIWWIPEECANAPLPTMALFAGIGILQIWLTNWLVRHISRVIDGGVDVENILTNFDRHDDFFKGTVTGTLADPVHCAFYLPCSGMYRRQ